MKDLDQLVGKLVEIRSAFYTTITARPADTSQKALFLQLPRVLMLYSCKIASSRAGYDCIFLDPDHGLVHRSFYGTTGYNLHQIVEAVCVE